MTGDVRTTRLENGLRIVTESVRDVASTALGVWVENGSSYEPKRLNGISHFIEHLLFKGTPDRSALQIAEEIETLGGSINGFTGKEYTCYHTRTLADHLDVALDVVADILTNSLLRNEDVAVEREVILQEIHDAEDAPEDFVHDYFLDRYWPGHPLGWTVAGSTESVREITRKDIERFLAERYRPDRMIIAVAGRVDHQAVVDLCRERLLGLTGTYDLPRTDLPDTCPGVFISDRDLEQVHTVIGLPGVSVMDERREVAEVLMTALGGGMSSRLFQSVREERGLAYSIYAFQNPFRDIGYSGIYAATAREHVQETCDLVFHELADLAQNGLTSGELERTKSQLVGSIPLALESTESRMIRIARNQIYFAREVTIEEDIQRIDRVNGDDIIELTREIVDFDRLGVALVGDADDDLLALPVA